MFLFRHFFKQISYHIFFHTSGPVPSENSLFMSHLSPPCFFYPLTFFKLGYPADRVFHGSSLKIASEECSCLYGQQQNMGQRFIESHWGEFRGWTGYSHYFCSLECIPPSLTPASRCSPEGTPENTAEWKERKKEKTVRERSFLFVAAIMEVITVLTSWMLKM